MTFWQYVGVLLLAAGTFTSRPAADRSYGTNLDVYGRYMGVSVSIGVPPVIIYCNGISHEKNHPASLEYPHDELETTI